MTRVPRLTPALGLAVVLAACSSDLPTFAPDAPLGADARAAFVTHGDALALDLCKSWVEEGVFPPAQSWSFRITGTDGTDEVVTRDFYGCAPLDRQWAPDVVLTIEEIVPAGFELRITAAVPRDGSAAPFLYYEAPAVNPLVVRVGDYREVYFKNGKGEIPPPPPPVVGGEGCTPGFWRQPHHYAFWADPYVPGETTWGDVFDAPQDAAVPGNGRGNAAGRATSGALTGDTLLSDAVQLTGGGVNALARHAVAALLNAASADVEYDLSVDEIIELVNDALASGNANAAKDILEGFNEQGCTVRK